MSRRPLSHVVLPAALVLLVAALAGCGGASRGNGVAAKGPSEILASAKVLADAASSVHVSGSIVSGGSPLTFNLHLLASKGGRGALSENGFPFELIQIHGNAYIKGSSAFYRHIAGPAAAKLLQGRWLEARTTTGNLAPLASLTDLRQLLDATLTEHGALVKGTPTTVAGRRAIPLMDTSQGGTLYVSMTGPPYPVELVKAGASAGRIVFDDWNKPTSVTAPTGALDIDQLQSTP